MIRPMGHYGGAPYGYPASYWGAPYGCAPYPGYAYGVPVPYPGASAGAGAGASASAGARASAEVTTFAGSGAYSSASSQSDARAYSGTDLPGPLVGQTLDSSVRFDTWTQRMRERRETDAWSRTAARRAEAAEADERAERRLMQVRRQLELRALTERRPSAPWQADRVRAEEPGDTNAGQGFRGEVPAIHRDEGNDPRGERADLASYGREAFRDRAARDRPREEPEPARRRYGMFSY